MVPKWVAQFWERKDEIRQGLMKPCGNAFLLKVENVSPSLC